jgi:hypothetical protein
MSSSSCSSGLNLSPLLALLDDSPRGDTTDENDSYALASDMICE